MSVWIVDVFAKREVSNGGAVIIMADDRLKHLIREKRDRRTNVRKTTMGRNEVKTVPDAIAKHTEHTNAYPVLEILFSQIFRHRSRFPDSADIEFFTLSERQSPLGRERCNSTENCFFGCFELYQNELAVHRHCVKVRAVRNCKLRMKLEPSFPETAEDTYNLF